MVHDLAVDAPRWYQVLRWLLLTALILLRMNCSADRIRHEMQLVGGRLELIKTAILHALVCLDVSWLEELLLGRPVVACVQRIVAARASLVVVWTV